MKRNNNFFQQCQVLSSPHRSAGQAGVAPWQPQPVGRSPRAAFGRRGLQAAEQTAAAGHAAGQVQPGWVLPGAV